MSTNRPILPLNTSLTDQRRRIITRIGIFGHFLFDRERVKPTDGIAPHGGHGRAAGRQTNCTDDNTRYAALTSSHLHSSAVPLTRKRAREGHRLKIIIILLNNNKASDVYSPSRNRRRSPTARKIAVSAGTRCTAHTVAQ